ncbi:bifunctional 3,4-dihydroxy-2-butanone-4-phosphate synthase/GTP cyclohydrolase II [Acanthopleuribacter pedis]|uniref:Riboflavin biosynthesis protein RibBA n=1 Tax=Acanthopleuribacter pedis TaxID=442870 RepID=A0A8J7U4T8_9BACT|nr:bifunctional 3,4-dihydroxy-2-butanone-4-phosphate synthase/GTP cyclohydrolase II [Acanthopleuribacter pedis]MBO1319798.1 bifunctional 3,4-dihydroxy-2-butanone-4-phosphate synthase/GTP cyclohydrolase II [Acanthopleuribacter pedis]
MPLASIEAALEDIKAGKFVIVVDDEDRENEGDLTMAGSLITPEAMNFMTIHGRGLICAPMEESYFERLQIPLMVNPRANTSKFGTSFGLSVGAATDVTTGISAQDRARTVQVLADPNSSPGDITIPGHIFPLRARPNGVLARRGHTEAAIDLARLAGLPPVGVICEILNPDGSMARLPQLRGIAAEHDLKIISIEDLTHYRRRQEDIVSRIEVATIPMPQGTFQAFAYKDHTNQEHLALCYGERAKSDVMVRLHSSCLTGDVFHSRRCDCGPQLEMALHRITEEGRGIVLYLAQEGRGIGLANKIKAYALQERGMDTVEANLHLGFPEDMRSYDIGAAILRDLGIESVRLLTNNPKKMAELEACGIQVSERVPHMIKPNKENDHYLKTKAAKLGHLLAPEHDWQ